MPSKLQFKSVLKKYKHLHGQNITGLTKNEMDILLKDSYNRHVNTCSECQGGYHCLTGGDLYEPFRRIVGFLKGPRHGVPPIVREFLKKYGDNEIVKMKVCRTPIDSARANLLNLLSFGQFNATKKKFAYDDLYHLFILATIVSKDGVESTVKFEKNHVLNLELSTNQGETCMQVQVPEGLSVKDLIDNGQSYQKSGALGPLKSKDFYLYDPINNNCQVFITSLIRGSNLGTQKLYDFILQDSKELLTPFAHTVARFVTDFSGRLDRLLYGDGLPSE